jgi:hypothetical protein
VQEEDRLWPIVVYKWNRTINFSLGGGVAGTSFGLSIDRVPISKIEAVKERQLCLAYGRNLPLLDDDDIQKFKHNEISLSEISVS